METALFDSIISYGALGAVAAYFAIKDWKLSDQIRQALNDFTVAMNVFISHKE